MLYNYWTAYLISLEKFNWVKFTLELGKQG